MTVRELEHRMEAAELNEWMVYFVREPWGPVQADLRAGTIAAAVWNAAGGLPTSPNSKKTRAAKVTDFFRLYDSPKPDAPQTAEEQIQIFRALADGNEKRLQDGEDA